MMRTLLALCLCSAFAASGPLLAQDLALPAPAVETPGPTLAPFRTVQPTVEAAPAVQAAPPPPAEEGVAPPQDAPPTTVAPVLVAETNANGAGQKVATIAVGVVGGVAGAAVAGPVGKFAGGFLGRKIAGGVFGKDKVPQITVVNAAEVASSQAAVQASDPQAAPTAAPEPAAP